MRKETKRKIKEVKKPNGNIHGVYKNTTDQQFTAVSFVYFHYNIQICESAFNTRSCLSSFSV